MSCSPNSIGRLVDDCADRHVADRRELLVVGAPAAVEALKRSALADADGRGGDFHRWRAVPPCFQGDDEIVGSFAGVPVRAAGDIGLAQVEANAKARDFGPTAGYDIADRPARLFVVAPAGVVGVIEWLAEGRA